LNPAFSGVPGYRWKILIAVTQKWVTNMRDVVTAETPRMGGNWLWAFFLAGLFVRFRDEALSRFRWFVVYGVLVFIPVQAIVRTYLSTESPDVNSENVLVLLSPLVLIFGVGLFFAFFDSLELPTLRVRYFTLGAFVFIMASPLALALLPPHPNPLVTPVYYPPRIQQIGSWLRRDEMMMSDIPWAVAWYGRRQCVWLTVNSRKDFEEVTDQQKPVKGLYITARTTDSPFFSAWVSGDNQGWQSFLLEALIKREVPRGFPLRKAPEGMFNEGQVLLMDYERWQRPPKD